MRINYNVSSIIARNALNNNDKRVSASTQKLSSGCKINSAADNASGLAIARRMNAQIKSLNQANQNANDGLSAVNTADGAMAEMHDILQRMNELAIQAANGTNADSDREMVQKEIDQLVNEIDRIASATEYNAQSLLDGSFAFKAYTNSENVKVMSYTEGVASSTYAIGQLTYYHYEDKITEFEISEKRKEDPDGNLIDITYSEKLGDITHKEHYAADNDQDKLLNSLVTTASVNQYSGDLRGLKAFPDGSKILVEDENIVIKAENDFEVKIKLNDRTPLGDVTTTTVNSAAGAVESITKTYEKTATGSSVVTTTSYSKVTSYRNIAVKGPDGNRYYIKKLNFFDTVDSAGDKLGTSNTQIYTGFAGDNGRDLKSDLAEYFKSADPDCAVEINEVKFDDSVPPGQFQVTYTPTDGKTNQVGAPKTITLDFFQDTNDLGGPMTTKELKDYKYSETLTTRTQYTVGSNTPDDCLAIDVTGMGAMVVQVGANKGQYIELEIPALTAEHLGVDKIDVTTEASATAAIDIVGNAINQLSAVRAKIGAYANRLEHTITNLDTSEENVTAAYSRIMDVDMATEMTEYSTVQVLVQASTSMLAQANERPQQVLQLLQ